MTSHRSDREQASVLLCSWQVIAFLEEQAGACERMQSSTASTEKAMWQVLRILATNAGSLRGQGRLTKGKPDEGLGECKCFS